MYGKYLSGYITAQANTDMIGLLQDAYLPDRISMVVDKLTLISDSAIAVQINGDGIYSDVYVGSDGNARLNFSSGDVLINSIKSQGAGASVFLAIIYREI